MGMIKGTKEITDFIIKYLEERKFFDRISSEYFGVKIPFVKEKREVFKKELKEFLRMALLEWNHEEIKKEIGLE